MTVQHNLEKLRANCQEGKNLGFIKDAESCHLCITKDWAQPHHGFDSVT